MALALSSGDASCIHIGHPNRRLPTKQGLWPDASPWGIMTRAEKMMKKWPRLGK
jgi:hypothetical protein